MIVRLNWCVKLLVINVVLLVVVVFLMGVFLFLFSAQKLMFPD